ncbi:MAG: SgcJ/EcaC family oxidoreductase [Hyphomicrobium sp.]|uniref:YybH family protein n=1 Tax=Hyphomicrobium sp. TaxID=82 RepID=UPI0039E35F04
MSDPAERTHWMPDRSIERLAARLLYALRTHDAPACAALFTEDCPLLSPYGPAAVGREAVCATHQAWFEEGETNKRLRLLDAGADGEVGYCLLAYSGDYPKADGSRTTESGKSLNVLERQTDGEWKIRISSLNSDSPHLA